MVAGLDDDPTVDYSPQSSTEAVDRTQTDPAINSNTPTLVSEKQGILDEKMQHMTMSGMDQHSDTWFSRWKYTIWRTAGMYLPVLRPHSNRPTPRSRRLHQLLKMTATRRLMTTLSRLLHSKSEVVAQIRKRLGAQDEVAIYLDDVQGTRATIDVGIEL